MPRHVATARRVALPATICLVLLACDPGPTSATPPPTAAEVPQTVAPEPIVKPTPVACKRSEGNAAAKEIQRQIRIMVDAAPIECIAPRDGKQCSILCVTLYRISADQRRAALVYLAGIAGLEINKRGVGKFSSVSFSDKSALSERFALVADAATIADFQRRAKADEFTAQEVIDRATVIFARVDIPEKRPR
jgi:hypothetical protein